MSKDDLLKQELKKICDCLTIMIKVVGIDNKNRLGVVDIDTTVNLLRTNVERSYNR